MKGKLVACPYCKAERLACGVGYVSYLCGTTLEGGNFTQSKECRAIEHELMTKLAVKPEEEMDSPIVNNGDSNADAFERINELEAKIAELEDEYADARKNWLMSEAKLARVQDALTARYHRSLATSDTQLLLDLERILSDKPKETDDE